jgi:serine/threonine protein kinase
MPSGPASGDVLGDRYVLKKSEWSTPLGPVWLARDRVLDRAVLVQLLAPALASKDPVRRTFQKAAARIAQIGGPGLLQVYDIGNTPAFAVLEHASGGRLSDRMDAGPMRPTDAARAVLGLARALESLHERGTWHGSLSPSNVFFDEEGRAKLFAVGLADVVRAQPKAKIPSDLPDAYLPPEADPIPADADRYALAALLYQMVTGSGPEPGVPARAKRRDVPPEIDQLLQRALSPDPKLRPALDEFEGALAPFARVLPPDVKEPRFRAAELRWLIPVVLIVALAIVALTVGVQIAQNIGKPKARTTPSTPAIPAGSAIRIVRGSTVDPEPAGNGEENDNNVPKAFDGNQSTRWNTQMYASQNVGGKPGVGILFDLGTAQSIARIDVETSLPGWTAEVRISDHAGSRAGDFTRIATLQAGSGTTSDPMPAGTRARFVLLWITKLAPSGDKSLPWEADISEIKFFAP